LNGCYPWNRNPLLLCSQLGGLSPSILTFVNENVNHCSSFKEVDMEMWMNYLEDLKKEAELNENLRCKAMDGKVFSSELLPAEYLEYKKRHKSLFSSTVKDC